MVEFVLLENLLDPVLEETQCLSVLFTNERDTGEVSELREILWLLSAALHSRLGTSLHQRFCTKIIILFQYLPNHSINSKIENYKIYYLLNSFHFNDPYNKSIIISQHFLQNDELWNRARRRIRLSSTRQWLRGQSRLELQSNSRMVHTSKCGMGTTPGSIHPVQSQFQQQTNSSLGSQPANKSVLSKYTVLSECTALWMEQQSSILSPIESSCISFTFSWNANLRTRMRKLWAICSYDQKRLVIRFQLCFFQYLKNFNHFLKFNESTKSLHTLFFLQIKFIYSDFNHSKIDIFIATFPIKMGSCAGQGKSNNYQESNQRENNNPTTNQGYNNNHNQGSTAGWAHQNYSGNIQGHINPFSWHNPFRLSIPRILFRVGCRKCGGLGRILRRERHIPCQRCYRHHGFCTKCYGTGTNFMRNILCRRCHGTGHRVKRHKQKREIVAAALIVTGEIDSLFFSYLYVFGTVDFYKKAIIFGNWKIGAYQRLFIQNHVFTFTFINQNQILKKWLIQQIQIIIVSVFCFNNSFMGNEKQQIFLKISMDR